MLPPAAENIVTQLRSSMITHIFTPGSLHPVLAGVTPVFTGLEDARVVQCGSNEFANFGASPPGTIRVIRARLSTGVNARG